MNTAVPNLAKVIERAIQKEVEEALTAEIDKVKAAIEKRVRERVGQITAAVCQRFSYEPFGTEQIKIIVDFGERK